jgi:hypothetical protein
MSAEKNISKDLFASYGSHFEQLLIQRSLAYEESARK